MKKLSSYILLIFLACTLFSACKKGLDQPAIAIPAEGLSSFKSSVSTVALSEATDAESVVTFSFKAPDYGLNVIPSYTLQFDLPADTTGEKAWANAIEIKVPAGALEKSFTGAEFNMMLGLQLNLPPDETSTLAVRLVSQVNQNTGVASTIRPLYATLTMSVKPYRAVVVYPALLVKGGNSWKTPAERTNGFLLTSAKANAKYEGYLNLPDADGWGGEAFTLISTKDNKVYGWGTDANTLSAGGGNLWLTPAPAYMKVNVDLDALTITYTPVKFFISGDDNGWSTSATPMVYNAESGQWIASNVSLTAGKAFAFTSNGSYDISYKLDKAENGTLIFAGKPTWGGVNIPVSKTGVYTVTLDLSAGDGNYTYSIK